MQDLGCTLCPANLEQPMMSDWGVCRTQSPAVASSRANIGIKDLQSIPNSAARMDAGPEKGAAGNREHPMPSWSRECRVLVRR